VKDTLKELIKSEREKIRDLERGRAFCLKHKFEEEARIIQVKIDGMFQVYDTFRDYWEKENKTSILL
jgi:hypothetical protein